MLDLRRFSDSSAYCDLEAGDYQISEIVAGIPGIEPELRERAIIMLYNFCPIPFLIMK